MKKKEIFISFVGQNDAGKLKNKQEGAILRALSTKKFDEVILLWNESPFAEISFRDIAEHVKNEIILNKFANKVIIHELHIKDVADHNFVYPVLKEFCSGLDKNNLFTAGISSGTPAMQVCWILLAESGDFSLENPLKLVRSIDPRFGRKKIVPVKLDTSLPRIISLTNKISVLESQKEKLIEEKMSFLPELILNTKTAEIFIGSETLNLSPVLFCYYRYFVERVINDKDFERFSFYGTSVDFVKKIVKYHEETFPDSDVAREEMIKLIRNNEGISRQTLLSNFSKIKSAVKKTIKVNSLMKYYIISSTGRRHLTTYGIILPKHKIKIT